MRRLATRALLLLALLVGFAVGAAAAEAVSIERGLLWKIERDDVRASYLLGTMHLADSETRSLAEPVAQAFAAADSLSIEVLITPEVKAQALVAALPRPEETLDKVLPPDLFDALVARAGRYINQPERIRHLKPWAVLELLELPPSEFKRQSQGELGLDLWLEKLAKDAGKPVYGLETGAEHIDALAGLPSSAQIGLLRATLRTRDPEASIAFMRLVYGTRDLRALAAVEELQLSRLGAADAAVVQAHLIDERNRRMVERMAPRLAEGNAFIAVGALHLPGRNGVLQLLVEQGYRVSPVY